MNFLKRDNRQSFILLFIGLVLVALDQGLKLLVSKFVEDAEVVGGGGSFLGFSLQWAESYKLIFGLDFESTRLLLGAFLSVVFALLIFYYVLSLIFIPSRFFILQFGISSLFAGWISNFISRLFDGYIVHFFKWDLFGRLELSFNLANVFQVVGWIVILTQVSSLVKYFYGEGNRRKQLLVMRSSQLEFVFYSFLAFFCLIACFLLMNYQFLSLLKSGSSIIIYPEKSFLKYSLSILALFFFSVNVFFLYFTNKIYGPVYAFERHIKQLLAGKDPGEFKLRSQDHVKNLEALAKDIKKGLN